MSQEIRPIWSGLPFQIGGSILALGLLAVLLMPDRVGNNGVGPDDVDPVIHVTSEDPCTRDLKSILNGMRPGQLGISTSAADLSTELNRWFTRCGENLDDEFILDRDVQQQLLDAAVAETLNSERFVIEDIAQIRMSLLAKEIVDQLARTADGDAQLVLDVFRYVIHNTTLVDPETTEAALLPATPYESLLWAEATAQARAWTFAELLRQVRLDAVVLIPQSQPEAWLVGVGLPDSGVQLFDCRLGLPIPGEGDDPTAPEPTVAATLQDILHDEQFLRKLDTAERTYPLTSQDLEKFDVFLIGTPSQWAERTAKLQFMSAPILPVDFYDGLGANALRPGASQLERVTEVGTTNQHWTREDIQVWQYPLEQLSEVAQASMDANSLYQTKMSIFAGPHVMRRSARSTEAVIAAADHTLHAVRIEQLQGNHREALNHFNPILNSFRTNPSQNNAEADNYGSFWTGISQYQVGYYTAAISTFDRYLSTVRESHTGLVPIESFRHEITEWKARVAWAQGNRQQAIEFLKSETSEAVSHRRAWLLQRWTQAIQPSTSE